MADLSRLRICLVSQQLGKVMSGPGVHTRILATQLHNDGHEVTVIIPESQFPENEVPYRLVTVKTPPLQSSQARWIGLSYVFSRKIEELVKSTHFDLIHFTDAREAFFCKSTLPTIGNINDTYAANLRSLQYYRNHYQDWLLRFIYYAFVHKVESIILQRFDALIANSRFTANIVKSTYSIDDNIWICYKAIQQEKFRTALESRCAFELQPPRILFVGSNMQRKGISDLIIASRDIINEIPQTIFRIVGQDKHIPKFKKFCRAIGVENNFEFVGWKSQDELIKEYSEAYLFVMPSVTEAFGIVFLEGMASGLPVIGTRVGGIPEIIIHEKNGILIPVNDPKALSLAILSLLKSPERCNELQKAGLKSATEFSAERMIKCTYQVYKTVLQKKLNRSSQT